MRDLSFSILISSQLKIYIFARLHPSLSKPATKIVIFESSKDRHSKEI